MTQTVLVLGASGKIGRNAITAFSHAGWNVRPYDRNAGDMVRQATGVDVIVNGLNPPNYHNWAEIIPRITRDVIAAAKATGATVILPGNVYNFGNAASDNAPSVWDEATPHQPTTRKGRIREEAEQAYKASGVRTIILRAGDFIDPTDGADDIMRLALLKDIAKGKMSAFGATDNMHAFCYLPDWGRAAVALADIRGTLDTFEDIPFGGYDFTLNDLKTEVEQALGRSVKTAPFPWWVLRLASPIWELARELTEMRYLWEVPHALSHAKFDRLVPDFERTALGLVMRASLPRDIHPNQPVAKNAPSFG